MTLLYVCLWYPPIVATQRHDKYVPAATNTYAAVEELFGAVFSVLSVSNKILKM
jgi:hypothetical protein